MNKSEILIMKIEPELKDKLEAAAEFDGVSMSEYVRRWIATIPLVGIVKDEKVIVHKED